MTGRRQSLPGLPGQLYGPLRMQRAIVETCPGAQWWEALSLAEHNAEPKPFVWTPSVASIETKLDRFMRQTDESEH